MSRARAHAKAPRRLALALAALLSLSSVAPPALAQPAASPELAQAEAFARDVERFYKDGDLKAALDAAEKALAIREVKLGKEHPLTAESESDLGGLRMALGDYIGADQPLRHAVDVLRKAQPGSERALAAALNNLARLLDAKNQPALAEPLLEEAAAILEKVGGPDDHGLGVQLRILANHHYVRRRFDVAEKILRRALAIHEKGGASSERELLRDLTLFGLLFRSTGRYPQFKEVIDRAFTIADKILGPKHIDRADLLFSLAMAYRGARQFDEAERAFKEVLAIYREVRGKLHPSVADVLSAWAMAAERKRDIATAVKLRREANDIEDHYLDLLLASGSTEEQKRAFARSLYKNTEATVSLHMWLAPNDKDAMELALTTILRRKGRVLDALSSGVSALRQSGGAGDQRLLDELSAVRSALAKLALKGPGRGDPAAYAAEIDRLYQRELALEAEVSARTSASLTSARQVTIEAVRKAMPEGSALIEMIRYSVSDSNVFSDLTVERGPQYYAAYILPKTGPVRFARLGQDARRSIDLVVEQVRRAFATKSKDFADPAYRLDRMTMGPIAEILPGVTNLLLSPDGSLNLIPFGALVDEHGHFRIHTYSFTYLTSGRDLLRFQGSAPSRQAPIVIADPKYNLGVAPPAPAPGAPERGAADRAVSFSRVQFPELPGTLEEAKAIGSIIEGRQLFTGGDATEGRLKSIHGPKILHIATHGFFLDKSTFSIAEADARGLELESASSPAPSAPAEASPSADRTFAIRKVGSDPLLRSGLALAGANARASGDDDGVLTALEALGLDLAGTKLVVLSACETALGGVEQGEGVYGLRRALVMAGSETQVMSLWKVDDAATRDLMTAYYQKLLRAGAGREEGMRAVQLAAINSRATSHPYYWAAFIVSGDPSPIEPPSAVSGDVAPAPSPRGCGCELKSSRFDEEYIWIAAALLAAAGARRRRHLYSQ